jgi:hypothetical protein
MALSILKRIEIPLVRPIPFKHPRPSVQDHPENAAIQVEELRETTPPVERQIEDKRGVMAWTWDYEPGEQKEIRVRLPDQMARRARARIRTETDHT